ncbi:MAG: hypothetical protein SFT93_05460 [Rickettsiaceae bacterium]|nr:hypothetical protein [Rickettsiaceae bacterium]
MKNYKYFGIILVFLSLGGIVLYGNHLKKMSQHSNPQNVKLQDSVNLLNQLGQNIDNSDSGEAITPSTSEDNFRQSSDTHDLCNLHIQELLLHLLNNSYQDAIKIASDLDTCANIIGFKEELLSLKINIEMILISSDTEIFPGKIFFSNLLRPVLVISRKNDELSFYKNIISSSLLNIVKKLHTKNQSENVSFRANKNISSLSKLYSGKEVIGACGSKGQECTYVTHEDPAILAQRTQQFSSIRGFRKRSILCEPKG